VENPKSEIRNPKYPRDTASVFKQRHLPQLTRNQIAGTDPEEADGAFGGFGAPDEVVGRGGDGRGICSWHGREP
jgi:hypothetical protein